MDYLDLANKDVQPEDFNEFDYKKHIVNPESINNTVEQYLRGEIQRGFEIGIKCFDEHFVCKEKSLYALTGKKGKGKTTINKIIQLMQSIVNGLVWVVAFQENSDWGNKVEYLQYFLGEHAKDVKEKKPELYKKASDWIDKHFIYLDVETIEDAIKVTEYLVKDGVKVHALLLDPVNSFEFGYKDTGSTFSDGVYSSKKVLRWCKKNISIYVSQHPTIRAQREKENVTPFDAEFGFWNNKAHFTWCINRENETNENKIEVFNVREKLTGGSPTSIDEPLIIEWFPTKINIRKGGEVYENVIQYLVRKHNPLNYDYDYLPETKEIIPKASIDDAFGLNNEKDMPF
jgi:hypothetical protein